MEREDRVARREDPRIILPGVKSVIMVGMVYWPGQHGFPTAHQYTRSPHQQNKHAETDKNEPARGIVSSYAWGQDYHRELGGRLRTLARRLNELAGGIGRFYVDTGAVLERDFAERARLGFIGKNSLIINARVGSGFFIGELFSTVALPLDGDDETEQTKTAKTERVRGRGRPGCGRCTRCIDACPTGAIVDDFVVDARRCISYLTIELKGSIPEDLRAPMGNRIYGCDICQLVCPWNRFSWHMPNDSSTHSTASQHTGATVTNREPSQHAAGWSPLFGHVAADVSTPALVDLLQADEDTFRRRFSRSPIKRIGRDRMARNAAIALGNIGGQAELPALQKAAEADSSSLVREHAQWAVNQVKKRLTSAT